MSWYNEALAGWYRSKIESANAMEQGIASFGSAIGKAIEETRQNSMANQIGSQEANSGAYAPRAALVSPGSNPDLPGTSNYIPSDVQTQGTAPAQFTGGYKGLQLQTAIDSLRRQQANTQSEMALRQAQAGYYGAHTQAIQENAATQQQRANTYQQSVNNKANGPAVTPQQFSKSATDLLPQGISKGWINVLSGNLAFSRGDVDENGTWKPSQTGSQYSYGNSPDELAANAAPVDTIEQLDQQLAKMRAGGGGGNQPATTAGGGQRLTPEQAAQLPPGTVFTGLDGKQYRVPANGG